MNWGDVALVLTAIGGPTTIIALYKWAKAQGRAEYLQEQSKATITAKNAEIEELRAENVKLWALLTGEEQ